MKKHTKMMSMIALVTLLMAILSGCSGEQKDITTAAEPVLTAEPAIGAEPEGLPDIVNGTRRQDGERFEDVIMLEGMEETVGYEHARNDALGIEIDYEYESFERKSQPDREIFVSRYDNPEDPQNYLEVTYSAESAETVAAGAAEELSKTYEIHREPYTLDHAGNCIRIDASADKNGQTPDVLKAVYIIPAGEGCVIAAARYSFEAADGFGKRISRMANSIAITGGPN